MDRKEIIKLIEDNGLTLHGDIEHFAALVAEREYERGVIDGRQMQVQSSVDKAVNAMSRTWVGLTLTQVKLLGEGVHEEAIKSGDSYNWVFYKHINEALKEKNT